MKKLILFSILILLAACGKPRTIKIIAKNAATGASYAGLEYKVISSRTAANGEKYKTEASGTLNSNGEAVVDVKVKKGRSYSVRIGALENICFHNELDQYFESKYDVNGTFTYKFAECAYLKFRYKNTNCQNVSDHIEITRKTNLDGYFGFYNPAIYDGCTDHTMTEYAQIPIGWWFFDWKVTKNGITQTFSDTVYISPNEYKYYEINY